MPATSDSAGKLVSRRTHAKSKKGCRTCKRRKVKCDEQRPSCGNCDKHNVTCDFLIAQPEPGPAASNASVNQYASPASNPFSSTPILSHGSPDAMQIDAGGLNMVDLQLLHNFTTFTHATLSSDPSFRHMLKTSAISMAFNCEFLMRTILALSALHLARFRLDKREYFVHIGLSHYQVACYQATALMDHVDHLTRENCENLHLFSVLTLFYALGAPKNDQTSLVIGDAIIPSWLTLLRSAEPILSVLNPVTYKGILSPLFSFGRERWNILNRDSRWNDSSLLVELETNINKSCTDPELLSIYNDVIKHLRNVLARLVPQASNKGIDLERGVKSPDPSTPRPSQVAPLLEAWDIFVWQWDAAKDFIPLLRGSAPQQEAITIYAHFLIMLKKLENQWWLEGWATHMMEMIWASLDDEHRLWIQWPIQEIGWVPP